MNAKSSFLCIALAVPVWAACSSPPPDGTPTSSSSSASGAGGSGGTGGGSGGSGGSGATGGGGLTAAEFPAAFAAAVCDHIDDCCSTESLPFDAASCTDAMESIVPNWQPSQPSFGTYDPEHAKACLDAAAAVAKTCPQKLDLFDAMVAVCRTVFVGARKPSESCAIADDCKPPADGIADCPPPQASTHPFQCVQFIRGKLGDACVATYEPDPYSGGYGVFAAQLTEFTVTMCDVSQGLLCDFDMIHGSTPTCVATGALGDVCHSNAECRAGLHCARPDPNVEDYVCAAQANLGESCDPEDPMDGGCGPDGYCEGGTSTCAAKKAVGDACTASRQCMTHACDGGACADYLSNGHLCVAP